jgi:hypothetical protein
MSLSTVPYMRMHAVQTFRETAGARFASRSMRKSQCKDQWRNHEAQRWTQRKKSMESTREGSMLLTEMLDGLDEQECGGASACLVA